MALSILATSLLSSVALFYLICFRVPSPSKCFGKIEESEDQKIKPIHFDSSSSSEDDDHCDCDHNEESQTSVKSETGSLDEETDNQQSTMWLGTEDCCIHVYTSGDNIRIRKNKIKMQLGAAILCIAYVKPSDVETDLLNYNNYFRHSENRVFVSLANGDVKMFERDLCEYYFRYNLKNSLLSDITTEYSAQVFILFI